MPESTHARRDVLRAIEEPPQLDPAVREPVAADGHGVTDSLPATDL